MVGMAAAGATAVKKTSRKNTSRDGQFRHALDTCSKNGDLAGALALYETAVSEDIRLSAYHFNSLLHILCSSVEAPAQSTVDAATRIFDAMVAAGIMPNEATITSMARIVARRPDGSGGDLAFDLVRTMGERYGATPRLRTYAPVLYAFCQWLEADKAYEVESHMASADVLPEEPEIAALLEMSAKVGRREKVYEYLHRLRSNVRCVAASTAEILENWFNSKHAAEVGSSNLDFGRVVNAILINGGGWHGLGWLGRGIWEVNRINVAADGHCTLCKQRLACVDIDQSETKKFAESVASLAMKREAASNIKRFQEWLEEHNGYDAIVDGANVALYQQNFADGGFSLSQLDIVVREIFKRNNNKWPLIVLHNRRIQALMQNPDNRQLLDTWRSEGALYTTPGGSNDDWYWLYAAVKLGCLLVTNDEMRDHIFELLGRAFFPMWKERHQVRYTFVKGKLMLVMPPPYSIVIQESGSGSWHVPLDDNCNDENLRTWLCIRRCDESNQASDLTHNSIHTNDEVQYPLTVAAEHVNNSSTDSKQQVTGKRKERSSTP
ncbi:proteinaceous RNase P 2 [Canna indica]|uniref:ribonuclease P n=1 Tax=Canna indica TaxID=4628 RepID=A0AAQ3QGQ2_9LILI|nr:proteinaceous RNase P 2 [Canna indica]